MIIGWYLILLLVLTAFVFILGHITESGEMVVVSIMAILIFGFLFGGHLITSTSLEQKYDARVIKTTESVILTIGGVPVQTFTDVKTYNQYTNNTHIIIQDTGWVDMYYNTNWNKKYTIVN